MGQPTGKGGGTGASSAASDSAVKLAESINAEISPVRGELTSQFLEALKTGGVGAQIPIIQRSIEANRLATQGALGATRAGTRAAVSEAQSGAGRANTDVMSQLAAGGLTGTPFAARVQAETATAGRSAVAQLLAQRAVTESDLTAQRAAYEATLPTDIAQSFISGAPAYSLGQTQQAFTGFGQGSQFQLGNAGIQSQRDIAKSGEVTKLASLGK